MTIHGVLLRYRKFIWAAGLFLGLASMIHVLLPVVVNTAAIRSQILSRAAQRFAGEVDFGRIEPALLPLPHAVVIQGRLSRSNSFNLSFAEAGIYPQIWPLLVGHLKIGRLKIEKPRISIRMPDDGASTRKEQENPFFRRLGPQARDVLNTAIPQWGLAHVKIQDGRLVFSRADGAAVEFDRVFLQAEVSGASLALRISGRSNLVRNLEFRSRIDLQSLDGSCRTDLSGLETARLTALGWSPKAIPFPEAVMDLGIEVETQGLTSFKADFLAKTPQLEASYGPHRLSIRELSLKGSAQWGGRRLQVGLSALHATDPDIALSANASWSFSDSFSWMPDRLQLKAMNLDVSEIRDTALQLAGTQPVVQRIFGIVRGGSWPELAISIEGSETANQKFGERFGLQGRLTHGRIVVPDDRLHLEAVSGRVSLEKGRLRARNLSARLGNTTAKNGTLQLGLMDGTKTFKLDLELDADLSELPATLKGLTDNPEITGLIDQFPPISGRATGRLQLGDSLEHITARLETSGRINLLDAALELSGTFDDLPSDGTSLKLSLSGPVGPQTVLWLGRRAAVPAEFVPKIPLTVVRSQITRAPTGALGLRGEFALADGLQVTAALETNQNELNVSKLHLKDAASDAVFTFRHARDGNKWQVGFSGNLDRTTADKLLQANNIIQGWIKGDLRADIKTDALSQTTIQGHLAARHLAIAPAPGLPLNILEASLEGEGNRINLVSAEVTWLENTARLSGSGTFSTQALNLDLLLRSESLDIDKMRQGIKTEKPAGQTQGVEKSDLLPVRGKVRVEAGGLTLGGYRFAPLKAVVIRQDEHTTMEILAATLCGIAVPGQIRYDRQGLNMSFNPQATKAALRDTDLCLAGAPVTERLEGTIDVSGKIRTHGRSGEELTRNLAGDADIKISDGRVYNVGTAGFFTNLLSFISVNQLIEGGLPDLRETDFSYKSLTAKLMLKDGLLRIEEGVLKSNAVNIVGYGDYQPVSKKLDLVLLVSPLTTVDWVIERIPLLGDILQGTLVAIPVGVKGPAVDPTVVPLSPTAVGSRLGGILERTVKTPFRILSPLWKDKAPSNQ